MLSFLKKTWLKLTTVNSSLFRMVFLLKLAHTIRLYFSTVKKIAGVKITLLPFIIYSVQEKRETRPHGFVHPLPPV